MPNPIHEVTAALMQLQSALDACGATLSGIELAGDSDEMRLQGLMGPDLVDDAALRSSETLLAGVPVRLRSTRERLERKADAATRSRLLT